MLFVMYFHRNIGKDLSVYKKTSLQIPWRNLPRARLKADYSVTTTMSQSIIDNQIDFVNEVWKYRNAGVTSESLVTELHRPTSETSPATAKIVKNWLLSPRLKYIVSQNRYIVNYYCYNRINLYKRKEWYCKEP